MSAHSCAFGNKINDRRGCGGGVLRKNQSFIGAVHRTGTRELRHIVSGLLFSDSAYGVAMTQSLRRSHS
ncbi:hypothetical protein Y032_0084g1795 [Ancylostoma ceylanicum]|uniref:Uncharacterized protein n=1 Tax=Ancylostoma ceylanicum TaxID=53326 RepID=A0A016TRV4_9BILA|nr:hypothetical protein Y032_0084g1795 [Ancylostoma ceylanicum]